MENRYWAIAALAAAATFAAPIGAQAADLGGYQGSYKDPAPAYTAGRTIWEGFHIGGHLGYAEQDYGFSQVNPTSPLVTFSDDANGIAGGVVYGNSWQFGKWVLGTDSEFTFSDSDSGRNIAANGDFASAEINYSTTSRARAGILVNPNLLIYGTAGIAFADVDVSGSLVAGGSDSDTLFGFAYGGGIETTLNNRWFARVEYLHIDYDDENFTDNGGGILKVDMDTDTVRGAVGYRFDWSPLDLLR